MDESQPQLRSSKASGWEGGLYNRDFPIWPWLRKQAKEHDLWRAAGEMECIQYLVLVAQPRRRARAYCAQGPGLVPHQQTDRQMCAVFSAGQPIHGNQTPEVIPVLSWALDRAPQNPH